MLQFQAFLASINPVICNKSWFQGKVLEQLLRCIFKCNDLLQPFIQVICCLNVRKSKTHWTLSHSVQSNSETNIFWNYLTSPSLENGKPRFLPDFHLAKNCFQHLCTLNTLHKTTWKEGIRHAKQCLHLTWSMQKIKHASFIFFELRSIFV